MLRYSERHGLHSLRFSSDCNVFDGPCNLGEIVSPTTYDSIGRILKQGCKYYPVDHGNHPVLCISNCSNMYAQWYLHLLEWDLKNLVYGPPCTSIFKSCIIISKSVITSGRYLHNLPTMCIRISDKWVSNHHLAFTWLSSVCTMYFGLHV